MTELNIILRLILRFYVNRAPDSQLHCSVMMMMMMMICVMFRGGIRDDESARLRQGEGARTGSDEGRRTDLPVGPASRRHRPVVGGNGSRCLKTQHSTGVDWIDPRAPSLACCRQTDYGASAAASCRSSRAITCRRQGIGAPVFTCLLIGFHPIDPCIQFPSR